LWTWPREHERDGQEVIMKKQLRKEKEKKRKEKEKEKERKKISQP
jgi:hypothetical protein